MAGPGKGRLGEWDISGILHETAHGEPAMKSLELKNFVNTYKRMSLMPKDGNVLVKNIVRGNGIPFLNNFHYVEHLDSLKKLFESKRDECVTKEELKDWYRRNINDDTLMENFDKIFNMIDLDLDGMVSWEELVGFLDMEMVERFNLVNGYTPPFVGNYIQGPTMEIPNRHRRLVAGMALYNSVNKKREIESGVGKYVSVSDNGIMDFYNLNMEHMKQITAPSPWKSEGIRSVVKTVCVMPEINTICLGCIARDLCFYDCSLGKVELVYHITNLDTHPVEMVYKFYPDPNRRSYLGIGGMDGSVTALLFKTDKGSPFKRAPGKTFTSLSFHNIRMGGAEGLELRSFKNLHSSWLERVTYVESLDCLMTTSNSSPNSLALLDVEERCVLTTIDAPLGITCADLLPPPPLLSSLPVTEYEDKSRRMDKRVLNWWIVTGGLDTRLRIWDLNDDGGGGKRRPRYTLTGHISRIGFLIVQYDPTSDCPLIISYGRIGRINVWNARTFENLQLYNTGLSGLAEDKPLAHCYDRHYKLLLLCTYKILGLKIGKFVDKCVTSGRSEVHEIVAVLYNHTYHTLISATLGSVITRWNPESGEKRMVIPMCHIKRSLSGQKVVGITAACFNHAENLLATGAEDGTVNLWDAYRGVFVRTCHAPGPVRWIFWLEYGLMVGTNEGKFRIFASSPPPDPDHSDFDLGPTVSYAVHVPPSYLVVGTIRGELIFADFATGRPIRRYLVTMPDRRLDLNYSFQLEKIEEKNTVLHRLNFERAGGSGRQPVDAIYLLESRKEDPTVGNLLVSLRSGMVQFWSTHPKGGFLYSFYALHLHEDRVVGFASDDKNQYLFTGLAFGYVKTWWIGDKAVGPEQKTRPPDNIAFPFLSNEFEDALAAVVARKEEDGPTLLNCYRAHSGAVAILIYFENERMLLTASMKMIRYWSLTGQFLNGFGSTLEWILYKFAEPAIPKIYRIPADLKRIVSNTSLKVITKDFGMDGPEKADLGKKDKGVDKKDSLEKREKPKKRSLEEEAALPWKRADVSRLWRNLKTAQDNVERVAPLPDLAQEQLYQHIPFEKTEKVTWVKPPKIIRSRRKRLELSLLYNNKFECSECKKERSKNQDRKELQPNKRISLREGVKLQEKEMLRKQEKQKCRKCYWRSKEKKYSSGSTSLLNSDLLGYTMDEEIDNLGTLAEAAASKRIDEATMFGKIVPTTKTEINDFVTDIMERKGIFDTPKNRKLIKNLIKLERNNAILNSLKKMDNHDENDLIKFDCFTKKEKEYVYLKARESLEEMEYNSKAKKGGGVSGIYSILANCLYETKYMNLPDNELLSLLINLSKKLKDDNIQESTLVGYKKRFYWWNKRKNSNMWDSVNKNITNVSDLVKQYVMALSKDSFADNTNFYDIVKRNLMKIVNKEPCPQCGEGYPRESNPESSKINEKLNQNKHTEIDKKFTSHLRNCLVKASVGEIREEDIYNELCKFFANIIHSCLPKCIKCQDKNFLDPNYSIGKEKEKRLLSRLDNVRAFCQASNVPYEKDLVVDYQRAVLHAKRKELCDVIEKQVVFQQEKELNISKYERRVEQLRNKLVLQNVNKKDKPEAIKDEIKATMSKIREEFARRPSN